MPQQYEVLSVLMREMGIPIRDLRYFQGRKRLQKTVYFAQLSKFGVDLGYGYSLYIHGPYSQGLAEAGYRIRSEEQHCSQFASSHEFRPGIVAGLRRLRHFIKAGQQRVADETNFLELAATLHYLWTVSFKHIPPKDRRKPTLATCRQRKKQFDEKARSDAFRLLETRGLIVGAK